MNSICVDANIVISCLSPDEKSQNQNHFLKSMVEGAYLIWVPSLINFEIGAALNRKKNRNLITDADFNAVIEFFFKLPVLMMWNEELLLKTHEFQKKGIRSYYDASYLAVASLKKIPLITGDQEVITKGKKIYPSIYTPTTFEAR